MGESLTIQLAFLWFESLFCLVVALYMFITVISSDRKDPKDRLMMVGNFLAAILLFVDFFSYTSNGQPGNFNFVMIRLSNYILFLFTALMLFIYVMYVCCQLFGGAGLRSNIPVKIPVRIAYVSFFINACLALSNPITHHLFYVDSDNVYHRDYLFYASVFFS